MTADSLSSRLSQRVTFRQPTRSSDSYGGATVSWNDLATVFADVQPVNSASALATRGGEITATAGYRITVRAREDIRADMQIAWNGHTLTIHSLHETPTTIEILAYEEMV